MGGGIADVATASKRALRWHTCTDAALSLVLLFDRNKGANPVKCAPNIFGVNVREYKTVL